MRILYFTSLKGVHGRKWLAHFSREHEVHVATFSAIQEDLLPGVNIHQIQNVERLPIVSRVTTKQPSTISAGIKKQITVDETQRIKKEAWLTFKIGWRYAYQFARLIDALQPDLIHAHQSVPFGWYALCAASWARHKAPMLVSVCGTDVMAYPDRSRLYRWMNRQVLTRATKITATSATLRTAAARFAPAKRIVDVVPFGVDTGLFTPKNKPSHQARFFGMAKYLKPVYRIDLAIRALALARKINHNISLELAGSGPQEEYLRGLAKKLGIESAVTFLGPVSQDKMPEVLKRWDAMLILSKQESFGVAALEAEATGIPVLAARVGGLPEAIEENKTGRFIDRMDEASVARALLKLFDDRDFLTRAHTVGPQFVRQNFEWQKTAQAMERVYREIIGGSNVPDHSAADALEATA